MRLGLGWRLGQGGPSRSLLSSSVQPRDWRETERFGAYEGNFTATTNMMLGMRLRELCILTCMFYLAWDATFITLVIAILRK